MLTLGDLTFPCEAVWKVPSLWCEQGDEYDVHWLVNQLKKKLLGCQAPCCWRRERRRKDPSRVFRDSSGMERVWTLHRVVEDLVPPVTLPALWSQANYPGKAFSSTEWERCYAPMVLCCRCSVAHLSTLWPHAFLRTRSPVLHNLPELAQTHVHWVSDAIQPSHPLPFPSPPSLNLSEHEDLFQWIGFASGGQSALEKLKEFMKIKLLLHTKFFSFLLS